MHMHRVRARGREREQVRDERDKRPQECQCQCSEVSRLPTIVHYCRFRSAFVDELTSQSFFRICTTTLLVVSVPQIRAPRLTPRPVLREESGVNPPARW